MASRFSAGRNLLSSRAQGCQTRGLDALAYRSTIDKVGVEGGLDSAVTPTVGAGRKFLGILVFIAVSA
jgi:hypothetical protein